MVADTDSGPLSPSFVATCGVKRKFRWRVHSQGYTMVARMEDGFLKLDVQLLAARGFRHDVARFTPICIGTATRTSLLRVTAIAFDEP